MFKNLSTNIENKTFKIIYFEVPWYWRWSMLIFNSVHVLIERMVNEYLQMTCCNQFD